jgi:hypothetical protein
MKSAVISCNYFLMFALNYCTSNISISVLLKMNIGIKIGTVTYVNVVTKLKSVASRINLILWQVSVLDMCTR